jgi:hypothetical protein
MRDHVGLIASFAARVARILVLLLAVATPAVPAAALTRAAPTTARAQGTAAIQDTAALRLRVVDSAQRAIDGAELFVVQLNLFVRTDADGVALLRLSQDRAYDIRVRKLGYLPASVRLTIAEQVATKTIVLRELPTRLAPVVTVAGRQGLTVFVSDTALRPLGGARVSVRGSGRSTRTDANGRAQMGLPPGSYLVHIERNGFAHSTIAVSVPKDSSREVAAWLRVLEPGQRAELIVEARDLFDLDRRMLRASPSMSRYFTRRQLEEMGIEDMMQLARRWASGVIGGECTVPVQRSGRVPITSVYTDEVEFVELYMPSTALKSMPRGNTSLGKNPTRILSGGSGVHLADPLCGNVGLIVWSRR